MKTGLLNWRKVLLGAQMLCLGAVAAIFLVTPIVSFAACGNNKAAEIKNLTIVGLAPGVTPRTVTGATVLNAANPGTPGGVITPITKFTLKDIKPGMWITAVYKGVTFQGTVFNITNNGGDKVAEIWVADPTPNTKNVKTGLVLKNVSLAGIATA